MKITIFTILFVFAAYLHCIKPSSPELEPGSVSGTVYEAKDSAALEGAIVRQVGTNISVQTGADGSFSLTGLPAGEVILYINKDSYASRTRTENVASGQNTNLSDAVYMDRAYGVLNGVVIGIDSTVMISQADVLLRTPSDSIVFDSTSTENNGYFVFSRVAPDTAGYLIQIHKSGFRSVIFRDTITAGDSIFVVKSLAPYLTITGTVYEMDSTTQIHGALIAVGPACATSDSLGVFTLADLVSADTGYQFVATGEYFDTLVFRDTITAADTVIGPIHMQRKTGVVQGTIRLQGQNDHSGIVVQVASSAYMDTTDSLGRIVLSGVPAGRQSILGSKENFASLSDTIDVKGNDTANVEFDLVIQSGTINTRVDWHTSYSPYYIEDTLEIATGGELYVNPGAEIRMANGARLLSTESGTIRIAGERRNPIEISPYDSTPENITVEIAGIGEEIVMTHTVLRDINVVFEQAPKIEYCLFLHTNNSDFDTSVFIIPAENSTKLDNCDFIRINSNRLGVVIKDSTFTGSDAPDGIAFVDCIFYLSAGSRVCSGFIQSGNAAASFDISVANSDFYSDCSILGSLIDFTNMDTTNIYNIEPGYSDPASLDFRLERDSELIDKSVSRDHLGALGLVPPLDNRW